MKRFFGLLLILSIAVAALCGAVTVAFAEQNDVTLDLDVQKQGDEVVAVVSITENDGIVDLYLRVEYDTEALELVDSAFGSALASLGPVDNFEEGGYEYPYRVIYVGNKNSTDTGKLLTLTFKIKSGAPDGDHDIKLVVRQVGALPGSSSVEPVYNTKYGAPLELGSKNVAATKQGGVVVAEKSVVTSGGEVEKIEDVDDVEEKGLAPLVIGLIAGGAVVFAALAVGAYFLYRKKKAKKASEDDK